MPITFFLFLVILLEPVSNNYGSTLYASGQLRIAFIRGNTNLNTENRINIDGRSLYGGAILTGDPLKRENSYVKTTKSNHFGSDYHVYSMIWSPDEIIFKVDGKEYGKLEGGFASLYPENENLRKGGKLAPFDQEVSAI